MIINKIMRTIENIYDILQSCSDLIWLCGLPLDKIVFFDNKHCQLRRMLIQHLLTLFQLLSFL